MTKQGRATHSGSASTKVEPKSYAVNPGYTDQIGQTVAFKKVPMYEGRGLEAPKKTQTNHHCGSQGKY